MKKKSSFTIVGGGIAGLTTAIALNRKNIPTTVFEAAPTMQPSGAGLALAANAIKAFQRLGIADQIIHAGRQLDAFTILDEQGDKITRTDSRIVSQRFGVNNFTIHRADLHKILLAQLPPDSIRTGKRTIHLNRQSDGITVYFDDGTSHKTDYLLVADGIRSPIRQQLIPGCLPRYAGYTCWRAVVNLPGNTLQEATETWGTKGRVGVVPMANDQVYWFACINAPAKSDEMRQMTVQKLADRFANYHAPIPELIAKTPNESLIWNDIIDLKPLNSYVFGRAVLLGDAAHATTPNMGQGACQAIEDAVILADELAKNQPTEAAFAAFDLRRLQRTHYITNTSWRIGQLAQTSSPLLAFLRNGLFRYLPESLNQRRLETLYAVDF
ncbi:MULTISPECIES: FAD-dependent monooxygenase [unclassified Spirosoma]|uniref:FAD-dependent monooxygenase n=1 Tax=unclassified Spirosoma TaxID=2621999 RepID=UPI0009692ED6|nr:MULTISPECIES: FAD-dependent monooxygenase [unclassified Spirosoma]MBN8822819.1 FAD-dependent monooxygenase [Spirosoma sp.]OJW80020.1 MAG: monooxygenase [Spirosoma sp. 48-14]